MKALENMTLKGALAFFLVCVAALMVLLWMLHPPTGDASQIGLLAGFVTLFIKMAADATGYQFSSSSGSDKKDDVQAKAVGALAEKVAPLPPNGAAAQPWWPMLTSDEKAAISTAAGTDPRVAAFVATAASGHGSADDLAYLVSKRLLTQARADVLAAA